MGVCVNQDLIDRKIKAHIWERPTFFFLLGSRPTWRSLVSGVCPNFGVLRSRLARGTPLSTRCLRWVLLVGHSLSNSVCSFHLQLSAALNVNYRGTLQLDISPFTLYLKQHAATSKSRGCLWCCKKKELQWSAKNQCNFLEPCFIHLLSLEVWSPSLEVHAAQKLKCALIGAKWRWMSDRWKESPLTFILPRWGCVLGVTRPAVNVACY